MKTKIVFLSLMIFLGCSAAFAQSAGVSKTVFTIERNTNANVVNYDARIVNGQIDQKDPIDSYWMMYAKDGKREEIGSFEKKAYGFKIAYDGANNLFNLTLNAVEDRNIKLFMRDGSPVAQITINDRQAFLKKVYVFAKSGFLGVPKVVYYTLYGIDIETGQEISEQINVK